MFNINDIAKLYFYPMANGIDVDVIGKDGNLIATGEDDSKESALVNALSECLELDFGVARSLAIDIQRLVDKKQITVLNPHRI